MANGGQAERAAKARTLMAVWDAGGAASVRRLDGGAAFALAREGYLSAVGGGRFALTALGRLAVKTMGGEGA